MLRVVGGLLSLGYTGFHWMSVNTKRYSLPSSKFKIYNTTLASFMFSCGNKRWFPGNNKLFRFLKNINTLKFGMCLHVVLERKN